MPSWRSGKTHGFCVTGGHSPIASEPTPSPRLWAAAPGATPALRIEHITGGRSDHSKTGTFYFARKRNFLLCLDIAQRGRHVNLRLIPKSERCCRRVTFGPGECAPAHVRGHFRGWRKALFASLAAHALGKASAVYLCRSEDVVRACYPGSARPGRIPDAWKSIYDRTAAGFGMPLVQLSEPIDLQMYRRRAPVYATWFYELQLPEWKSGLMGPKEAAEWPVTP